MGKSEIMADSTGRHGPRHMRTCRGRLTRRLRRGPSVREDWTNQGRALRRLGEPNAGRAYGSHRPAAVPQSALRGGSSQSHDLLRAFRVAYRSDTPCSASHFRNVAFSIAILSGLRPNDATKIAHIQKGPLGIERGQYPALVES